MLETPMCGRFVLTSPPQEIRVFLGFGEQPNFPPRYNIAPTQPVAVVRLDQGARSFALMRWGLLPSWVKDVKAFPTLINARAEGVATRPAFRAAMRRRRCLVPANGFYEWQKTDKGRKLPYFIHRAGGGPFAFAGLWETWTGPDGEQLDTTAIVTTRANRRLAPLHDRMPVVIEPHNFDRWLDAAANPPETVTDLLVPAPDDVFTAYPVSTRVNSVANDDPGLIEPLADPSTPPPTPPAGKRPDRDPGDGGGGQMRLL
nr:SOS response-associated peptidase [Tepidamorphus gemmatus]